MNANADQGKRYFDKVSCEDLRPGMYVQELDRPWLETPFLFQGFCIRNDEEIETLRNFCEYVFVDKEKEEIDPKFIHTGNHGKAVDSSVDHQRRESKHSIESHVRMLANKAGSAREYVSPVDVEQELETAKTIYEESRTTIENVFNAASSDGAINLNHASTTAFSIVDSVLRNPDAFLLLQRIKKKAHYRYTHAINCCALAATYSLHLGFTKTEIQEISMGALLLDIGITKLPENLLNMRGSLNPLMLKVVRHHVHYGIEILDNTPDLPLIVRDMISTHHERINGKGYPKSLKGEQIPLCGRIAAIVDCYDAMINDRPYRMGLSPNAAVCTMYKWRNIDFQEDLIEQFIQCIGAYPTGTLVELNTGQTGIVISQNRVRRLYPKILLILSADRVRYDCPETIDLWEYAKLNNGEALEIRKVVDANELGIDLADYYL